MILVVSTHLLRAVVVDLRPKTKTREDAGMLMPVLHCLGIQIGGMVLGVRPRFSWREHIVERRAGAHITPPCVQDLDRLWECGAQGCTVNWPDVARRHITERYGGLGDRQCA